MDNPGRFYAQLTYEHYAAIRAVVDDIRAKHSIPQTFPDWIAIVEEYTNPIGGNPFLWYEIVFHVYAFELGLTFDENNNVVKR